MKKIILLISCWSLTYFSSGNLLLAQEFGEEETAEFDDEPQEEFYPAEPIFENSGQRDNFDNTENQVEVVEPAPNEPEPLRPRRDSPPFNFGGGSRSFSRPSSPGGSGGGSFGKSKGDIRFQTTGQEQDPNRDTLVQKKEDLQSLKEKYRETFGQ